MDDRTYADDHSYADDRLHEKARPYLDERPLEDRTFLDDGSIIEEESYRVGVRPERRPARARTAAAQGARPVDEVRGLLTPGSLAQAVLLKEILGPPRAFNPYRPPMIGPRERSD